jgi:hypothetical protein
VVMPISLKLGLPKRRDGVSPPTTTHRGNQSSVIGLHDNLTTLFGIPTGEMFDLDMLAQTCKSLNKWRFLLISA